jgi:sugar phosphate isomerase/epimerase
VLPQVEPLVEQAVAVRYAGIGDEAAAGLGGQLEAVAALGWSGVELRTVGGVPLAELDRYAFDRVAGAVAGAGLRVVAVASRIGGWAGSIADEFDRDLAELDILARRCGTLGSRYVRIMSYPNAGLDEPTWRRRVTVRVGVLAARAAEAGIVLLHENCAGWAGADAERALQLLDDVDSPALGVLFDTGNGIEHGYCGYDMLARLVHRVAHVHVKDAVALPGGGAQYTVPGQGQARVAECLRLLLAAGYIGAWSIEPHLSLRPHDSPPAGDPADEDRLRGFLASGRALEALVGCRVLPDSPGWRAAAGGLSRA